MAKNDANKLKNSRKEQINIAGLYGDVALKGNDSGNIISHFFFKLLPYYSYYWALGTSHCCVYLLIET